MLMYSQCGSCSLFLSLSLLQAKTHHVMRQNKILAAYVTHIGAQLKRQQLGSGTATATTEAVFSPPADAENGTPVEAAAAKVGLF